MTVSGLDVDHYFLYLATIHVSVHKPVFHPCAVQESNHSIVAPLIPCKQFQRVVSNMSQSGCCPCVGLFMDTVNFTGCIYDLPPPGKVVRCGQGVGGGHHGEAHHPVGHSVDVGLPTCILLLFLQEQEKFRLGC